MRQIGLHLRFSGSFCDVARKALALNIPFFQCFLFTKEVGRLIEPEAADVQNFLELRRKHFKNLYVHGSYWINLARANNNPLAIIKREIRLAKELEFTHFVLHPGAAGNGFDKLVGINFLARSLNKLLRVEKELTFIIENTAHAAASIGGDLNDFKLLLEKLDHPEKILFCIDTAHAYSYGYDLVDAAAREQFVELIDTAIGISRVAMIHLNDTCEKLGSKLDKHELIGKGNIGSDALKAFVLHERLRTIPILMELPVVSSEQEEEMLTLVRGWCS